MKKKVNTESQKTVSETAETKELTKIYVRGAREHNLKNVDVDVPRNELVVVTGLSGSGKSSLAFDTLYAEGQRRYVECLSPYARQFLGNLRKPAVDSIEGLSPAISIEQKSISHNPRSTVGTVTEIYDYLRLLFARLGTQYCTECNVPVVQKSTDQIIELIMSEMNGRKIQLFAPLIKGRKGHYRELFAILMKQGFTKVRIDGEVKDIVADMQVSRYAIHDIELLIDRCVVSAAGEHRIAESTELALNRGEGIMIVLFEEEDGSWGERLFSTHYSCPKCGKSYDALAPNNFSFNSPYGACPKCSGLGTTSELSIEKMMPDDSVSIADGAILALDREKFSWLHDQVHAYCDKHSIDATQPASKIEPERLHEIFYGNEKESVTLGYKFRGGSRMNVNQKFLGIIPTLMHQFENSNSVVVKNFLDVFFEDYVCSECNGGRLKRDTLSVLVASESINDITKMDISECRSYFEALPARLSERQMLIGGVIIKEIVSRLRFLEEVGLSYLSLNRSVRTLSGGESQRIRLASQIGSELTGVMYVLDEPSIGLHQHDNNKLIASVKRLRDLGNTIIVVEHDKAMMLESDFIVDIGPGAGINGGEIIAACPPKDILKLKKSQMERSLTSQYLTNKKRINTPAIRREGSGKSIVLEGATGNNLKNVTLTLPLGRIVCISGMSGSGKSSLINDTLYPILSRYFYSSSVNPLPYKSISGLENIDKVIEIDQSPIGRTPRSNPATYTGLFTQIRDFFAMLPESKARGYKSGRFSFNVKGGRCEECEGAGIKKIEMNFLPDVYVTCDECNGLRYNRETLSVLYKEKSIADVLDMSVEEALEFFNEIPKLKAKIQALNDVGLTYIKLGQQAPTLSGGEAQRVKLATELSKTATGNTLYLLDEPTTGLHFEDINILLKLLDRLADKGNTVVVIEHNLDVIKYADWIIDLGPEGGSNGGQIIAEGTPEQIIKKKLSLTGRYLKDEL